MRSGFLRRGGGARPGVNPASLQQKGLGFRVKSSEFSAVLQSRPGCPSALGLESRAAKRYHMVVSRKSLNRCISN